jgi:hypothetical protein
MKTEGWREDAINWIHRHASELPDSPPTRWHVARPSLIARQYALQIIRHMPANFVPVELGITLDRGIELDWRNGQKELEIEVRSDGSIEILRCIAGKTIEESKMSEPNWRLGEAVVWLERP